MKLKTQFHLTAQHILYGISLANALRLGWAYAAADAGGQVLSVPGLFGALLGASISVGTAFIAGKLGGKLTQVRTRLVWGALILVLVLEVWVLAPITMTHLSVTMETLLGPVAAWTWAATLALVPSLVLAGVAVANGGLVEATAPKPLSEGSESQSGAESGSTKPKRRSKSQSEPLVSVECRYAPQCDRTFEKPTLQAATNAANAHARTCGFKPTVVMLTEQKVENAP